METPASHEQTIAQSTRSSDNDRHVINAPILDTSEGISVRSVDCRKRFEVNIAVLKQHSTSEAHEYGYDRDSSLFAMQDTFAHFKAWGNSIAAFQSVMVRTSLEFRLKEATEIRQRVLKILGNLQVSLYEGMWVLGLLIKRI